MAENCTECALSSEAACSEHGQKPAAWDCAIGTPDEDHDWKFVGGDSSVGEADAWVCQACGKVDDTGRAPPTEDEEWLSNA